MKKNYFERSEEWCSCCHKGGLVPAFRDKLNEAREIAGVPFILTSAFRCSAHNEEVGGSPTSSHLHGLAVDIKCEDGRKRFIIVEALRSVGLNRIGFGKNFIHVDMDGQKPQNVYWVY